MGAPSQQSAASAPEFAGILRSRLEAIPHKTLAIDLKVDASQLGKFLSGSAALKLDDISNMVRAAGLKAVSQNRVCITPEELRFLRRVYALAVDQVPWLLQSEETE